MEIPWSRTGWIIFGAALVWAMSKRLKRPLRSAALATACGTMRLSHRIRATGGQVARGWQDLVKEAREESGQVDRVKDAAGQSAKKLAATMHETAEKIEGWANKVETAPPVQQETAPAD